MFSTSSDEDIISNCQSAKLMTYADNMNVLNGTARSIYTSMCDVWASVGENVCSFRTIQRADCSPSRVNPRSISAFASRGNQPCRASWQ